MRWFVYFIYFIVFGCSVSYANNTYSQTTILSVNMKNKTVKEVFSEIEKKSEYVFFFYDEILDTERRVSINLKNQTIDVILDKLFENTNNEYIVSDRQIAISLKPEQITTPLRTQVQGITITGTVIDADGQPLPGAIVQIKGLQQGTATDANGWYTLQVPDGNAMLVYSYIGFTTQEITVGEQLIINVTLSEETRQIEEVVVIGYGRVTKKELTGAVQNIRAEDLLKTNAVNVMSALQTQVPADIGSSFEPGTNASVLIRGRTSITGGNDPMWVVDGIPMQSSNINLNTMDVVSINVLKDASAAAIYGARGANGVIIVTTKQAEVGLSKFSASYSGWGGFEQVTRKPKMMNGEQFTEFKRLAWPWSGRGNTDETIFDNLERESIATGRDTDWFDLVWGGQAFATNHTVTLNASGKNTGTLISFGYLDQSSLIETAGYKRYNLNLNNVIQFSERLKFSTKLMGSYSYNNRYSGAVQFAYQCSPLGTAYEEDGSLKLYPNPGEALITNPLVDVYRNKNEIWTYALIGSAALDWTIWDNLKYNMTVSLDFSTNQNGNYRGTGTYDRKTAPHAASFSNRTTSLTMMDHNLSYDKRFGDIHRIGAMVNFSAEQYTTRAVSVDGTDMYFDGLYYNLSTASSVLGKSTELTEWALLSFLGRVNYSLLDRYLLTASFRRDGTSRLSGDKWSNFPSLQVAWNLSEEPFMENVKELFLDFAKIRVAWGKSGKMTIDPYSTLGRLSTTYYVFGGNGVMGTRPTSIPNPSLQWESTAEKNLGIDITLFKSRLSGSIDIYDKGTDGLIMSRNLPQTSGYSTFQQNIGKTRNRGIELIVNGYPVKTKDFSWNIGFNFYRNKNEIVDLYGDKMDDVGSAWFIGQPVRVWYTFKYIGVWQENEAAEAATYSSQPGFPKFLDVNEDGRIHADNDRVIISQEPNWIGALNTTLVYKGFDFYVNMNTRQGQRASSGQHSAGGGDPGRYNVINDNYWTPDNPTNDAPHPWAVGKYPNFPGDFWIRDVSFVRLANVALGYTLPRTVSQKIGANRVRVYINLTNPYVWTKYNGQDPQATSQGSYPSVTSYQLGLNLNF